MKVLEIGSVLREPTYIYYINHYKATAKVEMMANTVSFPISFTVEMNPLGIMSVELDPLPREIDYPVLPLTKSIKEFIGIMARDGSLPQT